MEVLKDASATAIYGSRASNGVVLITTRQGEEGKTKVSYEGYYALQQLPKKLETLTLPEYAVYQNLRAATIGFGAREEFKDPSLLSRGTDWQNEIFRTAPMHNHQINISGGSKSMKYSLSGGYMKQDGIVFGSDFERFSFRVNMDNDINKWLTTGLRASVARTQQTNNVDGSGAIYNALNQLPEVPARNPDGSFGMQTENMYGTYFSNPLSDLIQNETIVAAHKSMSTPLPTSSCGKDSYSVRNMPPTSITATTISLPPPTTTSTSSSSRQQAVEPATEATGH